MGEILRPLGPLACVVGARPNYMKMAPLVRAFGARTGLPGTVLIHTGQHYDLAMNERLFADLGMPAPDLNLEVGSGTHAVQTAEVMRRFEPVVDELKPSCVVVVGDVNSTLAVSLVASKKSTPVVHVEAGLRSFDRDMPEEVNRVLTDQIADVLYTTERDAAANLAREGVDAARVRFVGNVMIDSLRAHLPRAVAPADTLEFWQALRRGVYDENDRVMPVFVKEREKHRFKLGFAMAAAVLGLAVAGTGFLVHPKAAAGITADSLEGRSPPRGPREKSGAA